MIKLKACVLIYILEGQKPNGSPYKDIKKKKVHCEDLDTFSSKYYVERDRDMLLSSNLRIPYHHTVNYEDAQLRYVEYEGKKYQIKSILKDYKKGERYRILDIEECK